MDDYDIVKIADWMVKEGYFLIHNKRYLVSEKFNREVRGIPEGLRKLPNKKLVVKEVGKHTPGLSPNEWTDLYLKFIVDCKVPRYGRGSDNKMYEMNKYSEAACKKFRQMLEVDGINLERLQAATAAYYADNRVMRVTITNYIIQGQWRTHYSQLEMPEEDDNELYKLG